MSGSSAEAVGHAEKPSLGEILATECYVGSRMRPRLRDPDYLILSDVLTVVRGFAERTRGKLFDFGSGGAPYRELFNRCDRYVCADVTPGPNVDRLISPEGNTTERNDSYDAVLSTQVLEHVARPLEYLRECLRILVPGGKLLVTTHGMFEEHACPHDYHRWTIAGLEQLIRETGFEVVTSHKLTTQIRGVFQLENCFARTLESPRGGVIDFTLRVLRKMHRWFLTPTFNWVGSRLTNSGVVSGKDGAWIYVGISVEARKPAAEPLGGDGRVQIPFDHNPSRP